MQNLNSKSAIETQAIPAAISLRKFDATVKAIQAMLRENGVKMSAIEIRELMRTTGLTPDETRIKAYVRQLRRGY